MKAVATIRVVAMPGGYNATARTQDGTYITAATNDTRPGVLALVSRMAQARGYAAGAAVILDGPPPRPPKVGPDKFS